MERLKERLAIARRALSTLQELLYLEAPSRVERDAAIQRFEYTTEALWKAAQRYLQEVEGISVGSPKGSIRSSWDVGLLTDEQAVIGLEMIDDRNLTVHTYTMNPSPKTSTTTCLHMRPCLRRGWRRWTRE